MKARAVNLLLLHSRYLSGPASGENRVVEDELRLLREAGHEVAAWQPSVAAKTSGLRLAADAVWSRGAARDVTRLVRERRPDLVHVHSLYPRLSPPSSGQFHRHPHRDDASQLPAHVSACDVPPQRVDLRGLRGSRALARSPPRLLPRLAGSQRRSRRFAHGSSDARHPLPRRPLSRCEPFRPRQARRGRTRTQSHRCQGELRLADRAEKGRRRAVALPGADHAGERPGHRVAGLAADPRARRRRGRLGARKARTGVAPGGHVPRTDRRRRRSPALRSARALVVPSRWYEGQPRAIVEAFAFGVPASPRGSGGCRS